MGLDMWIYEASKPNKGTLRSRELEELEKTYTVITKKEARRNANMYADLLAYCISMNVDTPVWNDKKFAEFFNLPKDYEWSSISHRPDGFKIHIRSKSGPDYAKDISLTDVEYSAFFERKMIPSYVTELNEITYWRKEYDIEEAIYDVYDEFSENHVENCGYHRLTQKMIEKLNKTCPAFAEEGFGIFGSVDDDNNGLFYHEWY